MKKRRTKVEMVWMENDVREWLYKTNNDPHKAWDEYIKDMLTRGVARAYYIKGIKDFIAVSEKVKLEDKIEEEKAVQKAIQEEKKESIINWLKGLTVEEYTKSIKPIFKQIEDKNLRMMIVNIWAMIQDKSYKGLTNEDLRQLNQIRNMVESA